MIKRLLVSSPKAGNLSGAILTCTNNHCDFDKSFTLTIRPCFTLDRILYEGLDGGSWYSLITLKI